MPKRRLRSVRKGDSRSLELLLVTDVTPPEFVYGKISGAFFNCKWILLSPILMVAGFWWLNRISLENCGYLVIGLLILYVFAAVLGIHSGLTFSNSRVAIANSLGTVFFLFVGIFVCINLVIAAGSSFERGFFSFLIFILGGGIGLFASMGAKKSIICYFPGCNVLSIFYFLRYCELPRAIYTRCFSGYGGHLRLGQYGHVNSCHS